MIVRRLFIGILLIGCILAIEVEASPSMDEASCGDKVSLAYHQTELPAHVLPVKKTVNEYCDDLNHRFLQFRWYRIVCNPDRWKVFDFSPRGNPLLYQEFGLGDLDNKGPVNLVLCGVHGDETVSVYQCFHLVREIMFDNPHLLKEIKVIVAPVVNPDGFFAKTRQNANGVDLNRNLPTADWDELSFEVWTQNNRDPRKFPGDESGSEIESRFQTYLVNRYKPDKIISFHSPLGFLDFDGPGDRKYYDLMRVENRAKYLGLNMEANTRKFINLVDFPFFPGSLGNYAGNERKIPTYTVEFKSSDPSRGYAYWSSVRFAVVKALLFPVYDEHEKNLYFSAADGNWQVAFSFFSH
jgi:protein MpaA